MAQHDLPIYTKALTYAVIKHAGQVRKYTGEDYINHPLEVVEILKADGWKNSDALLSAAILHDVIEDTDATYAELEEKFGSFVMQWVFWLTHIDKKSDGNRAMRMRLNAYHTAYAPHKEVILIKLADIISNARDIAQHDKKFAKIYSEEMRFFLRLLGGKYNSGGHPSNKLYEEAVRLTDPANFEKPKAAKK